MAASPPLCLLVGFPAGGEDDAYEEYGSEDYLDIQRLLRKETLCDAAIDGTFPADIKTRLDEEKKDSLLLKWLGVMTDEGGGPRESNQLKRIRHVDADELMEEDEPMKKKKMKNDDNNVKEDDDNDRDKEDDDTYRDKEDDDNDKNLGVSLKK